MCRSSSPRRYQTIAVDSTGAAYVTGYTYLTFPLQNPYQSTNLDVNCSNVTTWVTKLAPGGNALAYSTYLGGSCEDDPNGIAVDANGAAYIVGTAWSHDFPMVNAFQTSCPNTYGAVTVGSVVVARGVEEEGLETVRGVLVPRGVVEESLETARCVVGPCGVGV